VSSAWTTAREDLGGAELVLRTADGTKISLPASLLMLTAVYLPDFNLSQFQNRWAAHTGTCSCEILDQGPSYLAGALLPTRA
jgi:hypothetical protein